MSFDAQEVSRAGGAPVEWYKFTQGATVVSRVAGADFPVVDGGFTYAPESISRTGIDHSQEDAGGNITVRTPLAHPVALLFRSFIPIVPVTLIVYSKHRTDPEVVARFIGTVASCAFEDDEAALVCSPASQALGLLVPRRLYQMQCNRALYGPGCGVDPAAYKVAGTITATGTRTLTAAAWGAKPDGWFNNGYVQLASGERGFVVNHVGATLTLMAALTVTPSPGASVDAYPGCERTESVCKAKYNNLLNHLGFARIPTRNPFDRDVF